MNKLSIKKQRSLYAPYLLILTALCTSLINCATGTKEESATLGTKVDPQSEDSVYEPDVQLTTDAATGEVTSLTVTNDFGTITCADNTWDFQCGNHCVLAGTPGMVGNIFVTEAIADNYEGIVVAEEYFDFEENDLGCSWYYYEPNDEYRNGLREASEKVACAPCDGGDSD